MTIKTKKKQTTRIQMMQSNKCPLNEIQNFLGRLIAIRKTIRMKVETRGFCTIVTWIKSLKPDCFCEKNRLRTPRYFWISSSKSSFIFYYIKKEFHRQVWIGIERSGSKWYELNGQELQVEKADWAKNEPSDVGDCVVSSKETG